jgi:glycosyltransferase involved in cell wall biosynthesis
MFDREGVEEILGDRGAGMMKESAEPRTLVFSYRNIFSNALFRCPHYEFEDVISQVDSVDVLAPKFTASGFWYDTAKRVAYHSPFSPNPGIKKIEAKKRYDLFFALCGQPSDLIMANAALDWRTSCRVSVCLIDEFWISEIKACRNLLRLLDKFDVVALYYRQTVDAIKRRMRSKCIFIPPGVDAIRFCPYPNPSKRVVDVYSIGRRSQATHQKLLSMAAEEGVFYLHDSIAGGQAIHSKEHRALFANVAKRSRYFLVNPGYIDRPDITGDQIEIGNRYFEGAASGTIMIGEPPKAETFEKLFDWPDSVVELPYDSTHIDDVMHDMDRQPERMENIRRTNVTQALLRHDWAYRWESILQAVGLASMPGLSARKQRLQQLAGNISKHESQATGASQSK